MSDWLFFVTVLGNFISLAVYTIGTAYLFKPVYVGVTLGLLIALG